MAYGITNKEVFLRKSIMKAIETPLFGQKDSLDKVYS